MRTRSLASCILLLIAVIFYCLHIAQATEYKEVKAEEILKKIEDDEEVKYTHCRIVGNLNTNNISLKTVPNAYYYDLENNKLSKNNRLNTEFISILDVSDNLHVVESNIKITESTFEDGFDFSNVMFNDSIDLSRTTFNGSSDFSGANFEKDTDFISTNFSNEADFSCTNFKKHTEFAMTNFSNEADFRYTNFSSDAIFSGANFNSDVKFDKTTFNSAAYFDLAKFKNSANFSAPDTPDNIKTDGVNVEFFKKGYESETRYEDADTIYYNYRKLYQDSKDIISFSKWSDIISWITCGYGLKPFRIFWPGVFTVVFFALLYWRGPGIYKSSDTKETTSNVSYWDALYFSINTFTTLGSADWYPKDNFRKWVTLEGLCGWICLGIFMATLANVLIR